MVRAPGEGAAGSLASGVAIHRDVEIAATATTPVAATTTTAILILYDFTGAMWPTLTP